MNFWKFWNSTIQYWMDSTEDRINELEEKSIGNIQTKARREQRKEENRTEYKNLWDMIKRSNLGI